MQQRPLGLMFPAATAALPFFINVRDMGLLDTHLGVILPNAAFGLAMSIILFRRFKEIPDELREAALVDGATYLYFLRKIILPLSRPIIATVATIQFVHTWNNYILQLVLLNSESEYTWPLGIMQFQGEYLQEWIVVLAFHYPDTCAHRHRISGPAKSTLFQVLYQPSMIRTLVPISVGQLT